MSDNDTLYFEDYYDQYENGIEFKIEIAIGVYISPLLLIIGIVSQLLTISALVRLTMSSGRVWTGGGSGDGVKRHRVCKNVVKQEQTGYSKFLAENKREGYRRVRNATDEEQSMTLRNNDSRIKEKEIYDRYLNGEKNELKTNQLTNIDNRIKQTLKQYDGEQENDCISEESSNRSREDKEKIGHGMKNSTSIAQQCTTTNKEPLMYIGTVRQKQDQVIVEANRSPLGSPRVQGGQSTIRNKVRWVNKSSLVGAVCIEGWEVGYGASGQLFGAYYLITLSVVDGLMVLQRIGNQCSRRLFNVDLQVCLTIFIINVYIYKKFYLS